MRWLLPVIFCAMAGYVSAQQLSLSGRVTTLSDDALEGATVRLEPDRHLALTDKAGRFVIKGLWPGQYTIYISHIGYRTDSATVGIEAGRDNVYGVRLFEGRGEMDEVMVAGALKGSSPDNLLNFQRSAMPVTVIMRETIERMGSRRLDELLKEQTGLAIVSDISGGARATGIQMQGFGSEYVMVLIDGQPMTGRNAGNFDLSRISVSNIERIEIIKGASSCLFGSDALGGAINIVTRYGAIRPEAQARVSYGSLNIVAATAEGETPFRDNRGSVNLAANYYHSDGFNTDRKYITRGTTAPPYDDYSLQGRARYRTGKNGTIGMTGRWALRRSYMEKVFAGQNGDGSVSGDRQHISDLNASVYYNHRFGNGWRSMSRYYFTQYHSDMSVFWQEQNSLVTSEVFTQSMHRVDQQFAYDMANGIRLTAGLGGQLELMKSDIFSSGNNVAAGFAYSQADWTVRPGTTVMGGLRYDRHNSYGGKFNPSLGIQQKILTGVLFKLSAGTGFKTPGLKNRYQVFVNPLSNYMVIGTEILRETLQRMQAAGEISEIRQYVLSQLGSRLRPERSVSLNAGLQWKPGERLKIEAGVYYHHIRDQINSVQVATGTGNRQIFTYQNLPRSANKGMEASLTWQVLPGLEMTAGYQYLVAKDLSVRDSILAGGYPWNKVRNNETGETFVSRPSDYWGLENRSRHMANLRIFYSWQTAGLNFSFRSSYRSRYAFGDANNNYFIDRFDDFVDGYFLLNATIEKRLLRDRLRIRVTADNILGYTDRLMPAQPGRIVLAGIGYDLL